MTKQMNISTIYKVAQPKFRKEIPSFALSPPPKLDNMFGMEVEIEGCRRFIEEYQAMLSPEWGVTQDNSLRNTRGGVGLEFVSVPLTYTQLIQAVVKLYKQTGFKEENFSDRCSIHVHANVTDFTQEQLSALALFYQAIEDVLFDFVGHYRDTNIYCIPWSQCRMNHDLVTSIMDNGGVYKLKGWQKYTALNLLPILYQGTVEFRHMHGTANQDKICAWLTILNNLICLSKEHTIESSVNLVKSLSTEKDYSKFFSGIFGDILPFSDNYRGLLDTGVINAKYSMVNFGKKSPPLAPGLQDMTEASRRLYESVEQMRNARYETFSVAMSDATAQANRQFQPPGLPLGDAILASAVRRANRGYSGTGAGPEAHVAWTIANGESFVHGDIEPQATDPLPDSSPRF